MSNEDINNGYMDDEFGIPMPGPQHAWQDMLTRLDDDMPAAAAPLPNSIIEVGNGLMRGITSLLGLLFITAAMMLFSNNGVMIKHDNTDIGVAGNDAAQKSNMPTNNNTGDNSKAQLINKGDSIITVNAITNTAPADYYDKVINNKASNKKQANIKMGGGLINTGYPAEDIASNSTLNHPDDNTSNTVITPVIKDSAGSTTKSTTSTKPSPEQTQNSSDKQDKGDEDKSDSAVWQAGIWVKAQLPFSGAQHYFAGPNAASQPWRTILPGIWVSVQLGKKLIEAEVHPFTQTVYNPKPFEVNTIVVNNRLATETKRLNKTFGVSVSAGYSYNISGNWWLGGRVQGSVLTKAVGTVEVSNDSTVISKRFTAFAKDSANLQPFQVRLDAEALYKASRWAAGIRAGVYFSPSPIKQSSTIKNPLETEVFFRWRLWQPKK